MRSRVLGAEEVAQGLLELAVRDALAADQTAGAGRGAVDLGRCRDGLGYLRMPVDVEVVVGGEIDVVFAVDVYGRLGGAVGAVEEGVRHAHLGAVLDHPVEGELGTGLGEVRRFRGLFRRLRVGRALGLVHVDILQVVRKGPQGRGVARPELRGAGGACRRRRRMALQLKVKL